MESFQINLAEVREFTKNNKRKVYFNIILFILLILGIILVNNNYFMYSRTIAKVVKVENTFDHQVVSDQGDNESYYMQNIEAVIKNGQYKGEKIQLQNKYSYSGVNNDKYSNGNDLFIKVKESSKGISANIISVKRDKYVVLLAAVFLMAISLVAGKKGILSVISVIINILLFSYALTLYARGENILFLCNILIVAFSILSLVLVGGLNKQTLIAIVSTLLSVAVILTMYNLVIKFGEQPEYMMMEYISKAGDLEHIFMAGVLIGGLGAIMDVAISISVAVNELINKDNNISIKALIASVKEIGYDIMGTMINVLFFSYMCGTIPMFILKIKNDYQLISMLKFQIPFEIIRFLVGSIGIILTIPISGFVAILVMKKRGRKND